MGRSARLVVARPKSSSRMNLVSQDSQVADSGLSPNTKESSPPLSEERSKNFTKYVKDLKKRLNRSLSRNATFKETTKPTPLTVAPQPVKRQSSFYLTGTRPYNSTFALASPKTAETLQQKSSTKNNAAVRCHKLSYQLDQAPRPPSDKLHSSCSDDTSSSSDTSNSESEEDKQQADHEGDGETSNSSKS